MVGGCAVTEQLVPGYRFSRASYLAGLLRPTIVNDLHLHRHGLRYLLRDPSSFTPSPPAAAAAAPYLLMGSDAASTAASIAQFSARDALAYPLYEAFLHRARLLIQPLLDQPPPQLGPSLRHWPSQIRSLARLGGAAWRVRSQLPAMYELFTGPAAQLLDRWFESDVLKTTLATDAVIGANISPSHMGSAYVLLHHVMGEAAGQPGVWAYVQGGMGSISEALASAAREAGVEIFCDAPVKRILYRGDRATGVELQNGSRLEARAVVSNASPWTTCIELLDAAAPLPPDFVRHIRHVDYSSQCFKINLAVNALPNFACYPTAADGKPGPQHRGTIHFASSMQELENAYRESARGMPATRPIIEMTIPSALDSTLVDTPGNHVVQLFVQYAPYQVDPAIGSWADPSFKQAFVQRCFDVVEEFCPGFQSSIVGVDALSPLDLEQVFALHGGGIHHGSLSLHQLAWMRPAPGFSSYRLPLKGLYLCGAGAHPGGGVMGAPGRNAAMIIQQDWKHGLLGKT